MRIKKIIFLLIILFILNLIILAQDEDYGYGYEWVYDCGVLIKSNKLLVFKPTDLAINMYINPKYQDKIKNDSSIINGYIGWNLEDVKDKNGKILKDIYELEIKNIPYWTTEEELARLWERSSHKDFIYNERILYYKEGPGPTEVYISKDLKHWEKLEVIFVRIKNYWPKGSWQYHYYHATLYLKCSFFEGEYDTFYYREPG